MTEDRTTPPTLPCGHRTKHTQRIGCCGSCHRLFSSDSAFARHRRDNHCVDPLTVGLLQRMSKTVPGELMWGLPRGEFDWSGR